MATMLAVPALAVGMLTGCARAASSPQPDTATAAAPAGAGDQAFNERAARVLADWRGSPLAQAWRTGFVPLEGLTREPAAGFPTGAAKLAFGNGVYRLTAPLPTTTPPAATVTFPGGGSLSVPLVSAAAAYAAVDRTDPAAGCSGDDCGVLTVTGATLGTTTINTSRGVATVPAWLLTTAELTEPIARVAVAASAVTLLPEGSGAPWADPRAVAVSDAVADSNEPRQISAHLTVGACDSDIRAVVREEPEGVVIGGLVTKSDGVCIAIAKFHPVRLTLAAPVNGRVMLDAATGRPIPAGTG